jgi:hypothetical protein
MRFPCHPVEASFFETAPMRFNNVVELDARPAEAFAVLEDAASWPRWFRGMGLLSFIGGDLVAARWKQWRVYFTDIHPTGIGPQRQPGAFSAMSPLAGYPIVYNIEMDPHEDLIVGGAFGWVAGPGLKEVERYLETVKKYPNPPAPNITQFKSMP